MANFNNILFFTVFAISIFVIYGKDSERNAFVFIPRFSHKGHVRVQLKFENERLKTKEAELKSYKIFEGIDKDIVVVGLNGYDYYNTFNPVFPYHLERLYQNAIELDERKNKILVLIGVPEFREKEVPQAMGALLGSQPKINGKDPHEYIETVTRGGSYEKPFSFKQIPFRKLPEQLNDQSEEPLYTFCRDWTNTYVPEKEISAEAKQNYIMCTDLPPGQYFINK